MACQGEFGDPLALAGDDFSTVTGANGCILVANPFVFPIEEWIGSFNRRNPGIGLVGGLASGGNADEVSAFINGEPVDAVAVSVLGRTAIVPALSQGCRPIGEPFTVTRAEHNVIYAVGGQPAYPGRLAGLVIEGDAC
jgi:small ligand-binding sensory domain FIST